MDLIGEVTVPQEDRPYDYEIGRIEKKAGYLFTLYSVFGLGTERIENLEDMIINYREGGNNVREIREAFMQIENEWRENVEEDSISEKMRKLADDGIKYSTVVDTVRKRLELDSIRSAKYLDNPTPDNVAEAEIYYRQTKDGLNADWR